MWLRSAYGIAGECRNEGTRQEGFETTDGESSTEA